MVDDPFFKHKTLFFWSVFSLIVSCIFIGFSIYIFPHVFLGFTYEVPSFLYHMASWYRFYYHLSGAALNLALFLPFFITGLIFAYIVKLIDAYMDKEGERLAALHGTRPAKPGADPQTIVTLLKAVILIAILIAIIFLLQSFFLPDTID